MPVWGYLTWVKWIAVLVLAVGAIAAIAIQTTRLSREQTAHAETRESYAAAQLAAERSAVEKSRQQQTTVDQSRRSLDEARNAIRKRDADLSAARADTSGLRDQLAAAGRVSDPACPACQCPALGDLAGEGVELLARGSGLLRACAADHDERSAEVRALVEGWPK